MGVRVQEKMGLHIKARLRNYLEGQLNRQYRSRLSEAKRHISYEEWLRLQNNWGDAGYRAGLAADGTASAGESVAVRCAAAWEQGYTMLREQGIRLIIQRGGYMDPEAFGWIAEYFREHPKTQLLYGDEDALDAVGGGVAALILSRTGRRIPGCPAFLPAVCLPCGGSWCSSWRKEYGPGDARERCILTGLCRFAD